MSFKASLKIGSKTFDVLACDFSFHRDVDPKGRPSSSIYGGSVNVTIESTDDTSILEAMVNNVHKSQNGSITFQKRDEDAKMKELTFEKGYITSYTESLNVIGSQPMTISFTISAMKLKIGNAEHVNEWPDGKA